MRKLKDLIEVMLATVHIGTFCLLVCYVNT
jgi:hypothetical protein